MAENPTGWIGLDKPWVIMNAHFEDRLSREFYRHYYTERWGQIMTLEHIVRVQLLLRSLGIAYFMTQYSWNVMPRGINVRDPEWHYLWRQIDFGSWLDILSCYEWCRDHSGIAMDHPTDDHPSLAQHEAFTHRVILPHLAQRQLVDLS